MAAAEPKTLLTVQALRALAALAVAAAHLLPFEAKYLSGPALVPHALDYGQAGVDLFFVLSGFIVTAITAGRPRGGAEAARFLAKRALRIYPVYWVYFFAVLAVWLASPGMVNSSAAIPPDPVASFFLWPQRGTPLLFVSWTLTFEMLFYLAFAGLLWGLRDERALPAALAVLGAVVVAGWLAFRPGLDRPILVTLFNPLILEFLMGCAVALALRRPALAAGTALRPAVGWSSLALGLAGLAAAVAWLAAGERPMPVDWPRVALFGVPSALVLLGCVALEPTLGPRTPRPLVALGDASYSLYLGHVLVIAAVGRAWRMSGLPTEPAWAHLAALGAALAGCCVVALLSFRLLEAPLLARVRRALDRRPPAAADGGPRAPGVASPTARPAAS